MPWEAEPPHRPPQGSMEAGPGVSWWGRHKEGRTVTPEIVTVLSQAGCRAQHRAWHGRSRTCPLSPRIRPLPQDPLGAGAGAMTVPGMWPGMPCSEAGLGTPGHR